MSKEFEARFWEKVNRSTDLCCWNWQGFVDNGGYGRMSVNGKQEMSHRLAYSAVNGDIPAGMFILHKCDNRLCCNPSHLFIGTLADNNHDRNNKGRTAKGEAHGRAKLTVDVVKFIKASKGIIRQMDLARQFNVSKTVIRDIWIGKNWRSV